MSAIDRILGAFGNRQSQAINARTDLYDAVKQAKDKLAEASKPNPFYGMNDAQAAAKLARLLLPLDPEMAKRYETLSMQLEPKEAEKATNKKVAEAYAGAGEDIGAKFRAAAAKLLETDPDRALALLQRAEDYDAKREEKAQLAENRKIATAQYDEAMAKWKKNPEGIIEYQELMGALSNARLYGLNLINPVTDYTAGKQFEQKIDIQKEQNDFNRLMQEKSNAREDKKVQIALANLELDRQKIANDLAKTKEGAKLPAETTAKISNLQTVLTSLGEIETLLDEMIKSPSLNAGLELRGSVRLATENLGRVQSGGAITKDELTTFNSMIAPGLMDIADGFTAYRANVAKLKASINNKISNLASEGKNITSNDSKNNNAGGSSNAPSNTKANPLGF